MGTASVKVHKLNRWYCRGEVAESTLDGVLPSYQHMHIFKMLNEARSEAIRKDGYRVLYFVTAEKNTRRLQIADKEGYCLVDYFWAPGHYNVGMVKWQDGCPFPKWYCTLRFHLKRLAVHTKKFLGLYHK